MKCESDNFSVIIGASPEVDVLRRCLRRSGFANLGVTMSIAGLRREMITGSQELTIACIMLDETMVMQRSDELKKLLADANNFTSDFRCIGLVTDEALMGLAVELGCHFYVNELRRVAQSIRSLAGHWSLSRPLVRTNRFLGYEDPLLLRRRLNFPPDPPDSNPPGIG